MKSSGRWMGSTAALVFALSSFATMVTAQLAPGAAVLAMPDPGCPCITDIVAHLNLTVRAECMVMWS